MIFVTENVTAVVSRGASVASTSRHRLDVLQRRIGVAGHRQVAPVSQHGMDLYRVRVRRKPRLKPRRRYRYSPLPPVTNSRRTLPVITSAEEGGYVFGSVCLSVCLSVRRITRKLVNGF